MSAQTATRLDADEKSTVAIATVSAAHFRKLGQGSVSSARLDDDEKGAYIVRTLGDLTERRPSVPGLFNCPTVGQMKFAPPWRKVVEVADATLGRSPVFFQIRYELDTQPTLVKVSRPKTY